MCTVKMIITINQNYITVEYWSTHIGHILNIEFLYLSNNEKNN